jgi:hypothetical protein
MKPVFTMKPEKFAVCAGFDALAYVEALALMGRISLLVMFVVCIFCLPTNWSGKFVKGKLDEQGSQLWKDVFGEVCGEKPSGDTVNEVRPYTHLTCLAHVLSNHSCDTRNLCSKLQRMVGPSFLSYFHQEVSFPLH